MTKDLETILKFCEDYLLIHKEMALICGNQMCKETHKQNRDGYRWRCHKRNSRRTRSARKGSWFHMAHLTLKQILWICFNWSWKQPHHYCRTHVCVGKTIMTDWYQFCHDVCADAMLLDLEKIGGPGKIVEIDESKFGKMKYDHREKRDGEWVFGGVERGSNTMFAVVVVPNRNQKTYMEKIVEWIEPGTMIYSDKWHAYNTNKLCAADYEHMSVNHSKHFKDPETAVHTNSIEGSWHWLKLSLPRPSKVFKNSYFLEFMWRRRNSPGTNNCFICFMRDVVGYGMVVLEGGEGFCNEETE